MEALTAIVRKALIYGAVPGLVGNRVIDIVSVVFDAIPCMDRVKPYCVLFPDAVNMDNDHGSTGAVVVINRAYGIRCNILFGIFILHLNRIRVEYSAFRQQIIVSAGVLFDVIDIAVFSGSDGFFHIRFPRYCVAALLRIVVCGNNLLFYGGFLF